MPDWHKDLDGEDDLHPAYVRSETEPTNTAPGMLWKIPSSGRILERNAGDTDWIVVIDKELYVDAALNPANNVNLNTHVPALGGSIAKKTGYTGNLVGNGSNAVIVNEVGTAVYEVSSPATTADGRTMARIKVVALPTNGDAFIGVIFRSQASDTFYWVGLAYDLSDDEWFFVLLKTVAGAITEIEREIIVAPSVSDEFDIEFRGVGGEFALWESGQEFISSDDASITSAGKIGVIGTLAHISDRGCLSIALLKGHDQRLDVSPFTVNVSQITGFWSKLYEVAYEAAGDTAGIGPDLEDDLSWSAFNSPDDLWRDFFGQAGHGGEASPEIRGATKSLGASVEGVAEIATEHWDNDDVKAVFFLRESGTGKIAGVRLAHNGGSPRVEYFRCTDETLAGDTSIANLSVPTLFGVVFKFRYKITGGNLEMSLSPFKNGGWPLVFIGSVALTTAFTTAPDQVGLAIINGDTGNYRAVLFGNVSLF